MMENSENNMTKRKVMIHLIASSIEFGVSLFDDTEDEDDEAWEAEMPDFDLGRMPETEEMLTEGRLMTNETRVELFWEDSELTGMKGSVSAIGFQRNQPGLISVMRTGIVRMALTLEEGKRHYCLYNTPYSSFDLCVRGVRVENRLLTDGVMNLDYFVEIHGAMTEHRKIDISIKNME